MKTTYEITLDEFREANADLRRALAASSETREKQILANHAHATASDWHVRAYGRLMTADDALQGVRAEAPTPADIDVTANPMTNGSVTALTPEPGEMGIG